MSVQTSAPRSSRSTSKALAITVAAGPVLLLGALLWHPPLPGRLPDNDAVAEAVAADVTRWGLSHLAAAVAAAAVSVAFIVIRSYLRERGDGWFSAVGLALVVVGNTLYAVLPGMEFSALAAHETGTDIAAAQDALQPWFISVLVGGSVVFAAGTTLFAVAIVRSAPMGRTEAVVIAAALVVSESPGSYRSGSCSSTCSPRPRSWRYCRWQRRSRPEGGSARAWLPGPERS